MPRNRILPLLAGIGLCLAATARAEDDAAFFESRVRPVLKGRCESCHGAEKQKGGLRLDSKDAWARGGDRGPAIVPGKPDESILIQAIKHVDDDLKMPPKAKMPDREVASLVEWVRRGAFDPRTASTTKSDGRMSLEDARRWWAFQPVRRPEPPGTGNPIDAFIDARLRTDGLKPLAAADRRTLLRRATYDLTGLLPNFDESEKFASDPSPDAFAKVVDRLLASPAYGERWGRHWLDLVRYADTAGENTDHPLPHVWRYRNWVIDAFNRDLPYDEFVRHQIAGDLLAEGKTGEERASRIVATGYLALARRFGHDIDKDIHLTFEDVIDNTGKVFLGLTVGCARCHNHKYDPISAEDYYALYGILDSTKFANPGCEPNPLPRDLVPIQSEGEWDVAQAPVRARLAALDGELSAIDRKLKSHTDPLLLALKAPVVVAEGKVAEGERTPIAKTSIDVHVGDLLRLVILPGGNHGADSTRIEWSIREESGEKRTWDAAADLMADVNAGNPHADGREHPRVWWMLDGRKPWEPLAESVRGIDGKAGLNGWRNGGVPSVFVNATDHPIAAWTSLPARALFAHPAEGGPVAIAWESPVSGRITIEGAVSDAHPAALDGVLYRLEHVKGDLRPHLDAIVVTSPKREEIARKKAEIEAAMPRREVAYGVREGTPHDAPMMLRGDPEKLGSKVPRRWLDVLGGMKVQETKSSGRLELARWLSSPENPLAARVMVNRIWQQHFGRGLVATPSDFGSRGQPPSHPELLDWLASEFVASGWSIKALHRRIMLTSAYQRASAATPVEVDPENRLLSRFERRRLSAEELRDTLLAVAGTLDRTSGGPHPFPPENQWKFTQHNPFAADYLTPKRSVYLMVKRNRRDRFLGLFDGADPNASTPARQETTVPTQALFFLNSGFFHEQAEALAKRVLARKGEDPIDYAFALLFQRHPTAAERDWAGRFLASYEKEFGGSATGHAQAWAALARVLMSSNEFLYLD